MKSPLTTLCYVEQDDQYLMLHRISKKDDVNKDKWIGIGGHFEDGESPEECLLREAKEETGLTLTSWKFRGIVTFVSDEFPTEYMCLFTADKFEGELITCDEGTLEWVPKSEIMKLNLWEGDKIFLRLLAEDVPFFSLKLRYEGDVLKEASMEGRPLELFDICDENGEPTGRVTERGVAHTFGTIHRTAHIWVVREKKKEDLLIPETGTESGIYAGGFGTALKESKWELLLQKRSMQKDSFPGCYDTSAAGHVGAGDTCEAGAYRELKEELGIEAMPGELEFVGKFYVDDVNRTFHGKPFLNREMTSVYIYRKEVDEQKLHLQKEEVESVRWLDYEVCRELTRQKDKRFCMDMASLELIGNYLGMEVEDQK